MLAGATAYGRDTQGQGGGVALASVPHHHLLGSVSSIRTAPVGKTETACPYGSVLCSEMES